MSGDMVFEGWVDEVTDGIVWGRLVYGGVESVFKTPLLDVMESQRVSLQPGSYVYVVNGHLMVNNAIWTTHDMEEADKEALLWKALFAGSEVVETLHSPND
jgi:hypothetical protein